MLKPEWDVENIFAFRGPDALNGIPLIGDLVASVVLFWRCRKADVVIVNGAEYAWPRVLSRHGRNKTVVAWHGTRAGEVPALRPRMTLAIRLYWFLQIRLQGLALSIARHVAVAPEVIAEIRRWYGHSRSVALITNGAPPGRNLRLEPVSGRILWIGTTPYKKGLDIALDACRIVRRYLPHVTLRVVGTSAAAVPQPHPPWVDAAGPKSPADMPAEYAHAELILATTRYEGCSMAILEAMSYGVPVVGSASLGWMLGKDALCSTSLDGPGFATALRRALTEPGGLARMRDSASQRLAEFSWDDAARGYAALAEECVTVNDVPFAGNR
jgi:glycosyltransferase involved in cell wall biosynthesis